KVAQIEAEMKTGKFHAFAGPVVDQDGKQRLAAGAAMSDKDLGGMNYYVEGVTSKLPKS
ncbi:MAG TPA: BMP family ABC transporter substrate-binding protein, partial [Burkholderiales bacterium]|nr:BMP family ABC transporter substrate-binding protein [Burkholderiales bacterium]